jgi:hypothetical protein
VTGTRLLISAPIPSPDEWIVGAELPPGYMVLRSLTLMPRTAARTPGTALVPTKDIEAPADDLQRLVRAYALCDAAGRAELLKLAEIMAGAAP